MKIVEPGAAFVAPPGNRRSTERLGLFNLGFRPFYLTGAAFAAIALSVWLLFLLGIPLRGGYLMLASPVAWHAHEMVFGFATSVIAGFLLTAARAWTGIQTARGLSLAGLAGLWLCARVLVWSGPPIPAALIDSAFLPIVAVLLLRVLLKAGSRRNYFLAPILLSFGLLNVSFHWFMLHNRADLALRCLYAAVGLVVLLVSVIGARVIPAFTANAIPGFVTRRWRAVELLAAPLTLTALFADAVNAGPIVGATLAFAACATHGMRIVGWRSYRVQRPPILAILHLAYAWIPVGFALLGLSALGYVHHTVATHAFTAGVIGGAIIAMITRTARGHTARPLVADKRDIYSYVLVTLGSVLRVVGPLVAPEYFLVWIYTSGLCWIFGFSLYVFAYAAPLLQPRIDGKPG
jgi:uncharacterized protein involved in response to NO